MATTLARIVKYGIQAFVRNGWLSLATVLVMILALLVFEGLVLFRATTASAIVTLEDKIDIAAYFKTAAPEDDILNLERALEELAEVRGVEYISRDKALELFRAANAGNTTITQALNELEDNPLRASLNIKAHDPKDYGLIASFLDTARFKELIEKVSYTQSRTAIDRLASITNTLERIGFIFTIFFAITAALVTFNTIRLAIYSNREEIGIMRLVGASNLFINGPYVVQGILFGLVASVLSLVLLVPFIHFASPYVGVIIPGFSLRAYFYTTLASLLIYQLLLGMFLGGASSWVAVRKYLKI